MKPRTHELKARIDALDHLELFRMVLGISDLKPGKMVRSPIRKGDTHPSFNIYRKGKRYLFKDFAYEQGSIYDLVMLLHGCDFKRAVEWLASRTKVDVDEAPKLERKPLEEIPEVLRRKAECTWKPKEDDGLPVDTYWMSRYAITDHELSAYRVFRAEWFRMVTGNGKVIRWDYDAEMPLYVMCIGTHLKAYRPLAVKTRDGMKYLGNTDGNDVFGVHLLDNVRPDDVLLITAGQKDAIVATEKLGRVWAIAMNSESTYPTDEFMLRLLKLRCTIAICYDNDETGRRYSEAIRQRYPFIRNVDLGSYYPDDKDLADAYQRDRLTAIKPYFETLRNQ